MHCEQRAYKWSRHAGMNEVQLGATEWPCRFVARRRRCFTFSMCSFRILCLFYYFQFSNNNIINSIELQLLRKLYGYALRMR